MPTPRYGVFDPDGRREQAIDRDDVAATRDRDATTRDRDAEARDSRGTLRDDECLADESVVRSWLLTRDRRDAGGNITGATSADRGDQGVIDREMTASREWAASSERAELRSALDRLQFARREAAQDRRAAADDRRAAAEDRRAAAEDRRAGAADHDQSAIEQAQTTP